MPTVSKVTIYPDGKTPFLKEIKVDASGQFSIKLPQYMADPLGFGIVLAMSKDKVEQEFREACSRYEQLKTEVERVILYDIETRALIMRGGRCIHRSEEMHFTDGCAVSLCVGVFDEKTIKHHDGRVEYQYTHVKEAMQTAADPARWDSLATTRGRKSDNRLPWTQERQDFFLKLARAMESIILELDKIKSPIKAVEIINAGTFKMLPPTKGKNEQ